MRVPAAQAGDRPDSNGSRALLRSRRGLPHGRRAARVLSALIIAAGVLAVGSDPAQASAAEVESNRLSGATRYGTAIEIADAYVDLIEGAESGRAEVDTVIVTSGLDEHLGYVLPAPALSRRHQAPVLLTEPSRLLGSVRRFIERHEIERVIIVGGTDAVSADVAAAIDDLDGVSIERVGSNDVYATAVAVAARTGVSAGQPGDFGRRGRTVLLATGEKIPDALAAGPLAYRGQHPILLTQRDRLPDEVVGFLDRSGTAHVVILGGSAAVSTSVERRLDALGMSTTRWFGPDRYATAAEVARALLDVGSPQRCFDGADVGLASGLRLPDAIVSMPLLGEMCAPLLLTDHRTLPSATRAALSSTELFGGDADGRLTMTVFGGTAAVSRIALTAATRAASLSTVAARLFATEGGCEITVTFDEAVRTADASQASSYTRDSESLSGTAAVVSAGSAQSTRQVTLVLGGGSRFADASAVTDCAEPLEAGESVGVAGGAIRAAFDSRVVRRVTATARADRSRPRLSIRAVLGAQFVLITSNESVQAPVGRAGLNVEFQRAGGTPFVETATIAQGATAFLAYIPAGFDNGKGLEANDSVVIPADQFEDLAGNGNTQARARVVTDALPPRADSVEVSEPAAVAVATAQLFGTAGGSPGNGPMQLTARAGTAADGAAGNRWSVEVEVLKRAPESWREGQGSELTFSTTRRSIGIDALDGWTLAALAADLRSDSRFSELFDVQVRADTADWTVRADTGRVRFGGGASTVDIAVKWTEAVQGCILGTDPIRLSGIVIDTDGDRSADFAMNGRVFDPNSSVTFVGGTTDSASVQQGTGACDYTAPSVATGTIVARLHATDLRDLPSAASRAAIGASTVYDFGGNFNQPQLRVPVRVR